jgi:type IV pilus assembly protein PilM
MDYGMPGFGMGGPQGDMAKKLTTLTRTDFLIQFVWKPKKLEERPKDEADAKAQIEDTYKKMLEAQKNKSEATISEAAIEKASQQQSKLIENALQKAQLAPAASAPGTGTAPATPGAAVPGVATPGPAPAPAAPPAAK